jgi:uncharacterized membrane protein
MEKKNQIGLRSRQIALAALFAALYAAAVTLLAPISFQVYQVRVADCLLALSTLFGPPAIVGLTIGTLIGNLSSPFGVVDILGGAFANFVATFLAWQIGKAGFRGRWLVATAAESIAITLIVGTYLSFLLQIPVWLSWLGVLIGEVIAINVGGYLLVNAVDRTMGRRTANGPARMTTTAQSLPNEP